MEILPLLCQIHSLDRMSESLGKVEAVWQLRHRLKRIARRRIRYISNSIRSMTRKRSTVLGPGTNRLEASLSAGDLVRVRSKEEIRATLDQWNRLKGCDIMEEMWIYCDTTQRVFKRVEKFLDERDYLVKSCKGIVLLEGLICQGTVDYGPCDRSCYYFWREEWLEKI